MRCARARGQARVIILGAAALVACGVVLAVVGLTWSARAQRQPYAALLGENAGLEIDAAAVSRIRGFCGDCHAVPRPESFERDLWHEEVEKGYDFYAQSGRTDLDPPPIAQTVAYFRSRAPEQMVYPEPQEADTPLSVSFRTERLEWAPQIKTSPAIAGLCWQRLRAGEPIVLVASDMLSGVVGAIDFRDPQRTLRRLAQLEHPCHVEPCDLDGDGSTDLLVGDLGSGEAVDHHRGRVLWLRQDGGSGWFEPIVLASGLGRVTDARPIDVDSRGKLDVVVAEFGWYRTGKTLLLRNIASRGERPRFEPEELDPRTGTIYVPVCDLNGDGRPDFLALVSNETESVEAFLNQGNDKFHRQTLWQAPDLTFGSSGIWPADLNGDGRADILFANGDAFDNSYLSPWHGVQWLENQGDAQFRYHRITDMPGACVAGAGDFDGDGDLDILAVSFLPRRLKPDSAAARAWPSVVLLEQVSPGRFSRHTLERGFPCHSAAIVGDFNGDGRLDFAVANHRAGFHFDDLGRNWLTVWWNQGRAPR